MILKVLLKLQIKNINTVVHVQKAVHVQKTNLAVVPKILLHTLGLFSLLIFLNATQYAHADGSGIVKWKDDKGVTHYGDKIPVQYSNTENSIINKQGITVKRNKPMTVQDEAVSHAKIEQDKKDKALLSAFTNENEIDLARDRNLQLDKVTVEGLLLQKTNIQKRLSDSQKSASTFTARKKPVPVDLTTEIKNNQEEVAKIDKQIAGRKAAMEATRKRFDEDKKRYIALKNYANGSGPAPEAPEVAAPVSTAPILNPATAANTPPAATNPPPAVPSNATSKPNTGNTSKPK